MDHYSTLPLLTKILALSALLIIFVSQIWMVVLGFQRHVLWGAGLLVGVVAGLVPRVFPNWSGENIVVLLICNGILGIIWLVFLVVAWRDAQKPFFWTLAAFVLIAMAVFSDPRYKVTEQGLSSSEKLRAMLQSALPQSAEAARAYPRDQETNPQTAFRSKLPAPTVPPGEKEPPRPAIFYLKERIRVVTRNGIKAASPGEEVLLLKRLPSDRMLIQVGNVDFEVKSDQLTDDLHQARELEKQDFVSRGGRL